MGRRIAIIGDGAMGTLCSKLLAEKGCRVRMWSAFPEQAAELRATGENRRFLPGVRLPEAVEITDDAGEAFAGADLVISAVPAQFTRDVWGRLRDHCPAQVPICSVTKGIERKTLLRPTQILLEVLTGSVEGARPMAVLSGPCIAHEVARGLPATVVATSRDPALALDIQSLFTTRYLRVYTNPDPVGVELAGATKNVIAIAAGILDGLGSGDNAKAALLTRGLVEITRLGVKLGGARETFSGLAGLGDLMTTCVSPHGRNRSFGEAIGRGASPAEAMRGIPGQVEGVATTESVVELSEREQVEMPITRAVHAVLFGARRPADAIVQLMSRPPKSEGGCDP